MAADRGTHRTGRSSRSRLGSLAILVAALGVASLPGSALAATSDIIAPQHDPHTPADGWQAGTCITDAPQCTVDTPDQFFEEAAGHPQVGFTQFTVKFTEGPLETKNPVGVL